LNALSDILAAASRLGGSALGGAKFVTTSKLVDSAWVGVTASRFGMLPSSDISSDPMLGTASMRAEFVGLMSLEASTLVGANPVAASRFDASALGGAAASRLGDAVVFANLGVRRSKQRCLQRR
jgi:hypothetical protein